MGYLSFLHGICTPAFASALPQRAYAGVSLYPRGLCENGSQFSCWLLTHAASTRGRGALAGVTRVAPIAGCHESHTLQGWGD